MAPEQERGEVTDITPAADVYALGKLLHHMLTGRLMYREETDKAFSSDEVAADPRFQLIQEQILIKTILEIPTARIQSAQELLGVVDGLIKGRGGNAQRITIAPEVVTSVSVKPAIRMAESEVGSFARYENAFSTGQVELLRPEFGRLKLGFNDEWKLIYETVRNKPKDAKAAAIQLIESQRDARAFGYAIARFDGVTLYRDVKRLIEHFLRSSESQSGYPAVFNAPHLVAGLIYMGMSTIALASESWSVFKLLLTEKFEWYYQSGRANFSYGFAVPYFFHSETLSRSAAEAHDLYRQLLQKDAVVQAFGLVDEELLNTYLQAQLLMSLRAAQLTQAGTEIRLWPDFGRFHDFRVEVILDRIHHDTAYAEGVLPIFQETHDQFFEHLNARLALLQERMRGDKYFWDSVESWSPR